MKNTHMMQDSGVIGQEIIFDDNGEENKGVIKDIHEITGNYIVATDDGRTVLADKERDVISLGAIRKQAEAKKRFSFFEDGGKISREKGYKVGDILRHETFTGEFPAPGYEVIDILSTDDSASFSSRPRSVLKVKNLTTGQISEINEGRFSKYKFEDGGNIAKENNEMLHSQAKEAKHHIEELHNVLTNKTKVEPWVVAKMTRAKTDLSDITHYLDGASAKMQNGGKLTDAQQNKFDKVMREWKDGKLHSGSSNGPIVKNQDQAIAIAYSEAYGMDKMLFGGMVNELSDDTIDRMEGLVPISTLQELLDNAKFIIADMYEEGFEKDEIMSFLAYKISQIGGGNMVQSVSQVRQWTMKDEDALDGWISDIQDGYGWITPGYVESSWTSRPGSGTKEWNGDIQERVYQRLIDENMLFAENPNDYEKKGKKIKSVTTAIWTAAEENGYEDGGKMQTGGNIKKGDVYDWHTVEYDSKKGNNYKVVKQVEITDVTNGNVKGRLVGTSSEFIVREPNKYLKKKVSNKMATGGGVDETKKGDKYFIRLEHDKNGKPVKEVSISYETGLNEIKYYEKNTLSYIVDKNKNIVYSKNTQKPLYHYITSSLFADGGAIDNDDIYFATVINKKDSNYNRLAYSKSEENIKDKDGNEFDKLYFENKKTPLKYNVKDLNYNVRKIHDFKDVQGRKFMLLKELQKDKTLYYYIVHSGDKKVYTESGNMNTIKGYLKNLTNGKDFYSKPGVNFAEGGKMQTGGMVIDKGLEQFKNDEIAEDKDASIHLAQFTGKSIKAQSTDKTWDDGSPVTKYFSRNGFKTINPTGTHYILESDSWWYFKIGRTWYAVKKADYGTPPFEYSHGGKMQTAGKMSGWKHKMATGGGVYGKGKLYEESQLSSLEMEVQKLIDELGVMVSTDTGDIMVYPDSKPDDRWFQSRNAQAFKLAAKNGQYKFLSASGYRGSITPIAKMFGLERNDYTGIAGRSGVSTFSNPISISLGGIKKIVNIMHQGLKDESKAQSDFYKN